MNPDIIRQISLNKQNQLKGVKLLNVDSSKDANPTVVTFAGESKQLLRRLF